MQQQYDSRSSAVCSSQMFLFLFSSFLILSSVRVFECYGYQSLCLLGTNIFIVCVAHCRGFIVCVAHIDCEVQRDGC